MLGFQRGQQSRSAMLDRYLNRDRYPKTWADTPQDPLHIFG